MLPHWCCHIQAQKKKKKVEGEKREINLVIQRFNSASIQIVQTERLENGEPHSLNRYCDDISAKVEER